ncbi:MAG: glutamate ABC transporter substrate-binding protein [Actinobacteria bacterium]|nr:glutamate ABC transporter substrate-binding protein [Actinomycetota bacterium]
MSKRRLLITSVAVLALLGAACGGDNNGAKTTTSRAQQPKFAAGTTMARLQAAGRIKVGTKYDQPGFGLRNPTTGKVEGFDVEIAKRVAEHIFGAGGGDKVEFTEAVSKNREPYIQNGTVDLVVATYTINDARKQVVDFAGPYFVAKQDIMVKKSDTSINSVADLNGKKVCTVSGSTSEKNLRAKAPTASVTLFDTYSKCAEALTDGRVVAVTTDNTILAGLVQASNDTFKLLERPFSDEPYGIGLKKGDEAFRSFLNDTLEKIFKNGDWAKAFGATLGKLGLKAPQPPALDRYAASATATSTAAGGTSATTDSGGTASTTPASTSTTVASSTTAS